MTKSGKRLFSWCIVLALILACAPAAISPIPTLDPNAINTFIVQTANAATTQTAAAVPVLTATSTLIATFTPEPTFTNVPVIILSSPTLEPQHTFYRVKHDTQMALYNYKSRTADPSWPVESWGLQTPEVVRLTVDMKLGSGDNRTPLIGVWEVFIDALNNNNEKTLGYLKAYDTALFNGTGFPQLQSLTMGGNLITLDEIKNGWGRVHTMDYNDPGKLNEINYITRPDLVHKFVVVGWNRNVKITYFVNPPPGDTYWPFVSNRPVWIPLEYLEAFPPTPLSVVVTIPQTIRTKPEIDSPSAGHTLAEGDSANVVAYYPSGSDVWGRLPSGNWIVLFRYDEKGRPEYPTSWQMATLPPIP